MKSLLQYAFLILIISGCTETDQEEHYAEDKFAAEMLELKEYFQIPGLAVSVEKEGKTIYRSYSGFADLENKVELDATALFPIASITKVFSGTLIMKLAEQGKLSLEDPIIQYFPELPVDESVLLKHVLSHTSQGTVGKEFYYSSRFGLLTKVIEQASGKTFADLMQEEIFTPLSLENTFLLEDSTQVTANSRIIAKPYVLDEGIEDGFIDFGYSASAGIVSNLDDLAIFTNALDDDLLMSKASKASAFSPASDDSPYGYGIFTQKFEGVNIVWAYGQYDCYSSLLLKIPAKNITLTLLANNNLLSDPARLIYGDVTSSLFAISFLKNYIFGMVEMDLFEGPDVDLESKHSDTKLYQKKLLAQALAESFMARFQPEKLQSSAKLLETIFTNYPDYLAYADLSLLHNLSFLKDVAFYMELGEFNNFDAQIVNIGEHLLDKHPENPYANSYLGAYYARKGNKEKAKYYFERIIDAKNFSQNWYTQEARNWLSNNE